MECISIAHQGSVGVPVTPTYQASQRFAARSQVNVAGQQVIYAHFVNTGKSVANAVAFGMDCEILESPPDARLIHQHKIPHGNTVIQNEQWRRNCIIPDRPPAHTTQCHLYGKLTYTDVFEKEHAIWFCRRFNGNQFILDDLIGEQYNGQT